MIKVRIAGIFLLRRILFGEISFEKNYSEKNGIYVLYRTFEALDSLSLLTFKIE